MSELKCPFCNEELELDEYDLYCKNCNYNKNRCLFGNEDMWQELIRTRKALDLALDALTTIGGYLDYNDCVGVALDAKDEIYETLEQKGE